MVHSEGKLRSENPEWLGAVVACACKSHTQGSRRGYFGRDEGTLCRLKGDRIAVIRHRIGRVYTTFTRDTSTSKLLATDFKLICPSAVCDTTRSNRGCKANVMGWTSWGHTCGAGIWTEKMTYEK